MEKNFELLKERTEVIVNGISTRLEGDFIARPYDDYMDDVWEYLQDRFPGKIFGEGEAWDYDPRFDHFEYDEFGKQYICLNIDLMKEDEVYWDTDCVFVDTSNFPSYSLWDFDKIQCLSEIETPGWIFDLSNEELQELRGEISLGSIYLSDYNNSMFIDRRELSSYCESYDMWLKEEKVEDSPEMFAHYIENVA